jgi:thiamine biosynthesis lipoprotein
MPAGAFSLGQMTIITKYLLAGMCQLALPTAYYPAFAQVGKDADSPLTRFTFTEAHMGTRFKIILYTRDESAAKSATKAAFQRISDLDGIMNDYRSTSELMKLCQKAGGEPVRVSDDLFRVLEKSQEVAKISDGTFDVTIGPVSQLWRQARRTHEMPNPNELAQARELVGYRTLKLDLKNQTVQLLKAGMRLDLGGIGKGYAADAALAVIKDHGIGQALVAAGGDIAVSGPPPGTEGWNIGIAPLLDPDAKPKRYLILQHAAVSTSGDSEQYLELNGKRYSHIIDPRTGMGLTDRMSVTVVAPNGITADPLTKVVCILGPEHSLEIIERMKGVAALLVRQTDKGLVIVESKRFKTLKQEGNR